MHQGHTHQSLCLYELAQLDAPIPNGTPLGDHAGILFCWLPVAELLRHMVYPVWLTEELSRLDEGPKHFVTMDAQEDPPVTLERLAGLSVFEEMQFFPSMATALFARNIIPAQAPYDMPPVTKELCLPAAKGYFLFRYPVYSIQARWRAI